MANLTQPWSIDPTRTPNFAELSQFSLMRGFKNAPAPIAYADLEREYCHLTRQPHPIPEMTFANSWMLFRVRNPPILPRLTGQNGTQEY